MTGKTMICIECPQGCLLTASRDAGELTVTGGKCPRGAAYARREIENPVRLFTSSVLTEGLEFRLLPVRTTGPIPKGSLIDAMGEIRKLRVSRPVSAGDVLVKNFMGLGVDLAASRRARRKE